MKAARRRQWWVALIGRKPVEVCIWDRDLSWVGRGRTTEQAWDGARAAAKVFGGVTLSRRSPWHEDYMPVITAASMSWDVQDR